MYITQKSYKYKHTNMHNINLLSHQPVQNWPEPQLLVELVGEQMDPSLVHLLTAHSKELLGRDEHALRLAHDLHVLVDQGSVFFNHSGILLMEHLLINN